MVGSRNPFLPLCQFLWYGLRKALEQLAEKLIYRIPFCSQIKYNHLANSAVKLGKKPNWSVA